MIDPVIISILGTTISKMIAYEIIGVHPISSKGSRKLKTWFATRYNTNHNPRITNGQYAKFLRLNNRKKTQSHNDIVNAGYDFVRMSSYEDLENTETWCKNIFGKNRVIRNGLVFYFSEKEHYILFKMRFL